MIFSFDWDLNPRLACGDWQKLLIRSEINISHQAFPFEPLIQKGIIVDVPLAS